MLYEHNRRDMIANYYLRSVFSPLYAAMSRRSSGGKMNRYGVYLAAGLATTAVIVGALTTINGSVTELMTLVRLLGAGIVLVGLAVLVLAVVMLRQHE